MKLTIEAKKLANTIQRVQACVAKRTPHEVYKRVLCEAHDKQIHITGTDFESWIRVSAPAIVEDYGKTVLPPKELSEIAQRTEGDLLFWINDKSILELSSVNGEYNLTTMEPQDFAPIDEREVEEWLKVSTGEIVKALRLTMFAASTEEGKFAMRGLLFEVNGQNLTIVSTDSKRMAKIDIALSEPRTSDKPLSVIVSKDACNLLLQNLLRIPFDLVLQIGVNYNTIYFKTDDSLLASRLTEGRFPPYRDVIPKLDKLNLVKLNRKTFLASLERVRMLLDDECRRVSLSLNGTQIVLRIQHTRLGKGEVTHKLEHSITVPVTINFDPEFLLELFRVQDFGEDVTMFYRDSSKPVLFVCGSYTHLIVPLT